ERLVRRGAHQRARGPGHAPARHRPREPGGRPFLRRPRHPAHQLRHQRRPAAARHGTRGPSARPRMTITDFLARARATRMLVVGDVMTDAYLWGRVDRISPEAPVPVVQVTDRSARLGGAANVALNAHAFGAT